MSLFITFEGGEGCGKSVQARALYKRLSQLAVPALLTLEPGGTPLGDRISRLVKWGQDIAISPLTELLLFNASRAQLVAEVIKPSLKDGKVVICDRFADSTTAYQSYGRGLDLDMVMSINHAATLGLQPDLTILLDIPAEAGLTRKKDRKPDRCEQENIAIPRRVREGYHKLAAGNPKRWLVVDAALSKAKVTGIIWDKVERLLSKG
ncbi:MAG: dTMP kinase [Chloroflexota bacterium]|nr:dTMP kinase [Chloroflexota bacterium]